MHALRPGVVELLTEDGGVDELPVPQRHRLPAYVAHVGIDAAHLRTTPAGAWFHAPTRRMAGISDKIVLGTGGLCPLRNHALRRGSTA